MRCAHVVGFGLVAGLVSPFARGDGGGPAAEEAVLVAAQAQSLDQLGYSAAVDRETLVVGTPFVATPFVGQTGAAYVFALGPGGWVQQAELREPFQPSWGAYFGAAVAVEGDRVAVSARSGTSQYGLTGSVSVFVRTGSTWTVEQEFAPPDGGNFGGALDLEDGVLLVGDVSAPGVVPFTGAAYVFERLGGTWTQTGKLFKAQGEQNDNLGRAVALATDTALVADPTDELNGELVGSFTIFDRVGTSWVEGATLFNPDPQPWEWFGTALDEDGDVAVVGAWGDSQFGPNAGVAYVYARDGTTWTLQQTLTGDGLGVVTQQERFGQSVAIDGGRLLVGSPWDDVPGAFRIGSVYRFELAGGTWIQVERIAPAGLGPADSFGWAVGLDGDLVAGTAPGDDTAGQSSGAAYVLRAPPFRTHYCTAGTSASGCKALISASGVPSATAPTGFDLRVEGVEGAKRGLFYWGANGRKASPWGTGTSYQCLKLPPSRGKLLQEQGAKGACDGVYTYDLNKRWTVKPNQNPGAGATVQAQFWYRDPFNGFFPKTSLSDAIEFVVCP